MKTQYGIKARLSHPRQRLLVNFFRNIRRIVSSIGKTQSYEVVSRQLMMETLEPRVLLSADISGTLLGLSNGQEVVPGDNMGAIVRLVNTQDALSQPVRVDFFASKNSVLDDQDILVGSFSVAASDWRADGTAQVTINMDSKILLPGHYNLIGVIDPDNAIKETKENNNLLRGAKINVSYIVGEMAKHSDVSSIALRDSDGTQFNLAISGPGQAQLNPVTGGYSLTVIGSDASTRINLNNTSGGDGKISLVDIDIQGSLASLNAASAIISGTANFNNIIELVVGESTATATIQAESIGQLSVINNAGGQWRINNTAAIPNAVADIKIGGTLYGKWQIGRASCRERV